MPFFSATAYSGFGDDSKVYRLIRCCSILLPTCVRPLSLPDFSTHIIIEGFYGVYSAIFQRITDEELEFVTEASASDVPPIFGE